MFDSKSLSPEERRARANARYRCYRERHPERVKASMAKYRAEHRDEVLERQRKWRDENPEKAKQASQRWRKGHPEQVKATHDAWFQAHREEVNAWRRANYAPKSADFRERVNAARTERKQHLVDMMGGKCVDCGAVPHLAAFEFDHVTPDKSQNVSMMLARPSLWEQAVAEAKKCELVCANCHRIRTANRTGRV